MKAINVNDSIRIFSALPKVWDNKTITSDRQYYAYGFRDLITPELLENQYLGKIYKDNIFDVYTYEALTLSQEELDIKFLDHKTSLILKFERDTDNLIKEIVGERAFEYQLAEAEAIAFKAVGYPENDVPASVSSDAIANNYSNTIACDLILTMATNWRGVQTALRAQRLLSKANAKNALTIEELNTIEADWDEFLAYIKQQII